MLMSSGRGGVDSSPAGAREGLLRSVWEGLLSSEWEGLCPVA